MNKANVFLLVVVSSLLTYISTATQPAATAGVAQEKWGYFTGYEDRRHGQDLNGNRSTIIVNRYPAGTVRSRVHYEDQDTYEVQVDLEDGIQSSVRSRSFADKTEAGKYSVDAAKELLRLSGEYGWHVFQVTKRPEPDSLLDPGPRGRVMYWRRRVQ